jgi:hypothetical protein
MTRVRKRVRLMFESLEKYEEALVEDPAHDAMDEELEWLRSIIDMLAPSLKMPLLSFKQRDFGDSFWSLMRENRREEAFIKFLGVPLFLFDELAKRMKVHLSHAYDRDIITRGRHNIFDHVDLTAIALRRLRVACSQKLDLLCTEFGRNKSVVARSLDDSTPAFFAVLREAPSSDIRYPFAPEVRAMITGKKAELGVKGLVGLATKTVLMGDGTVTPATKDPVEWKQRLLKGHKGQCWNHILFVRVTLMYLHS